MNTFGLAGKEIIDPKAKKFGVNDHVFVPKDWLGTDVKVTRISDPDEPTPDE